MIWKMIVNDYIIHLVDYRWSDIHFKVHNELQMTQIVLLGFLTNCIFLHFIEDYKFT